MENGLHLTTGNYMRKVLVNYKGFKTMAPVIEHNTKYKNFLISNSALQEGLICFTYIKCGISFKKVIPTMKVYEFMKQKKFFKYDEDDDLLKFNGMAYSAPESIIFNFKG